MDTRAAILTISDKASRGEREDTSGPALKEMLEAEGRGKNSERIAPLC